MEQLRKTRQRDRAAERADDTAEVDEEASKAAGKAERRRQAAQLAVASSSMFAAMVARAVGGPDVFGKDGRAALTLSEAEVDNIAMEHAVQKHMRRSVTLEAVTAFHITVGEAEFESFAAKQELAAKAGLPAFERLPQDLSAPLPDRRIVLDSQAARKAAVLASAIDSGLDDVGAASRVAAWERSLSAPSEPKHVHLWVKSEATAEPLADVKLVAVDIKWSREERFHSREQARAMGETCFYHGNEDSRLELRGRLCGERVVTAVAAAPMSAKSKRTAQLRRIGMRPLGLDLAEIGLAAGLQLWVKEEGGSLPERVEARIQELKQQDYWSPDLFRVIELLQLRPGDVEAWHDAFEKLGPDQHGYLEIRELVQSLGVPFNNFTEHVARFMDVGTVEGRLSFGQWARVVSGLALMDEVQLAALTFAYLDTEHVGAVSLSRVRVAVHEILKAGPPGTSASDVVDKARGLSRDSSGLIASASFCTFIVRSQPAVLYPVARMRDAITTLLMGKRWWDRKMQAFTAAKDRLKRTRELARVASSLPGTSGEDVDTLVARYAEIIAERAPLVAQCFVERIPEGQVAVVVPNEFEGSMWAKTKRKVSLSHREPLRSLCGYAPFVEAVRDQIRAEERRAALADDDSIKFCLVVPLPFTVTNMMLAEELVGPAVLKAPAVSLASAHGPSSAAERAPMGGGPGAPRGLPQRDFLREVYREEISRMAERVRDAESGMQKAMRGIGGGIKVAGAIAGAVRRGLAAAFSSGGETVGARTEARLLRQTVHDHVARGGTLGAADDPPPAPADGGRATGAAASASAAAGAWGGGGRAGTAASGRSEAMHRSAAIRAAGGVAALRAQRAEAAEARRKALVQAREAKRKWLASVADF
ncbi:hypothetical protein FNF27_04452 [Cafeteria roenbergensis]|uniref:EF-hand domain-containing protein n=2 Tax=Cafeteria roenbergensis TaxID=33653 RepID=A0A5A8E8I8_CAFRO|nr:hypothetical protein FNF28_07057 [Cafeteria roenbergensis]KAA0156132.1 hypothetical protein FNF31_05954 [Cafeteria roenbergensis]KAA0174066.1 hypothetical protein FNF27_04452 [Cafeteria roenbergensis]